MTDLAAFLDEASAAVLAGDFAATRQLVDHIEARLSDLRLSPSELEALHPKLERLQRLSSAAEGGIEVARQWVRDLQQSLGGLDVYGREGRRRVETALSGKPQRF